MSQFVARLDQLKFVIQILYMVLFNNLTIDHEKYARLYLYTYISIYLLIFSLYYYAYIRINSEKNGMKIKVKDSQINPPSIITMLLQSQQEDNEMEMSIYEYDYTIIKKDIQQCFMDIAMTLFIGVIMKSNTIFILHSILSILSFIRSGIIRSHVLGWELERPFIYETPVEEVNESEPIEEQEEDTEPVVEEVEE